MNKKDCENISWILAQYDLVSPDMLEEFFRLDDRIRDNYNWDRSYVKAKNQAPLIYDAMMSERYGKDWHLAREQGSASERSHLWKLAEEQAFEAMRSWDDEE